MLLRALAVLAAAVLAVVFLTLMRPAAANAAATLPSGFQEKTVISGLTEPITVQFSKDGRVFVAEKSGLIKVFDNLSDTTPTTFADLRTNVHNFWDRGMLGMVLDPNFPTNPSVYVLYTHDATIGGTAPRWGSPGATSDPCPNPPGATSDGCVVSGRLSKLTASGDTMTGPEQVLIEDWCQQYPSHSVGSLVFGSDGALYVSGGDGASFGFIDYGQDGNPLNPCGDPPGGVGATLAPPTAEGGALRSQDLRTSGDPVGLNGSILRVDPATGNALPNNPLISNSDPNARRIISYGLRNPFRQTLVARPGTDEVWVGDVGMGNWEEINRIANPTDSTVENFGWPCYEGNARHSGYDSADLNICENLYAQSSAHTPPNFTYNHAVTVVTGETCPTGSSSIAGLAFYKTGPYPDSYDDALFFADYSRDCIWVMKKGATGLPDPATRATFVAPAANPVDLQIGPNGDLFYVDFSGGTIRRIEYSGAPTARATASPTSGPAPLTVNFDGSSSSDPDGVVSGYLSDKSWTSATNGWGPVEKDMSNATRAAGDGLPLTLNGTTYAKGLGVHALSDVRYDLGRSCSRFTAKVGVDDEVGSNGSIVFEVWADGSKVYDSGLMRGDTATKDVDVDVSGKRELGLVVNDGGNGITSDHGDWADAQVSCDPLTYAWDLDGNGTYDDSTSPKPTHTYSAAGNYDVGLKVTDGQGMSDTLDQPLTISVGNAPANTPPTASIDSPLSTTKWKVGDNIPFSGSATDQQDGTLPASALNWDLILHHCPSNCHEHPLQSFAGVANGSFDAPDHEYPSYLELRLTATDSGGSKDTESVRLDPQTVELTFRTDPTGLQLVAGGAGATTPFSRTVIVGSKNSISAPSPQSLAGTTYEFASWSDGGARSHDIVAPNSPSTYTATYSAELSAPSNLSAIRSGGATKQRVDLNWTDNSKAEAKFVIERSTSPDFTSNLVSREVGANVVAYRDTDVPRNTKLYYRVFAVSSTGVRSASSNVASVTIR